MPAASIQIPGLVVNAGDTVTATITKSTGSLWNLVLNDNTTGGHFAITLSYASSMSSAEWIQEDPSYTSSSLVPLDIFGTVAFSGVSTTFNGSLSNLLTSYASKVTLVSASGVTIATTSSIGGGGTSFSVTHQ